MTETPTPQENFESTPPPVTPAPDAIEEALDDAEFMTHASGAAQRVEITDNDTHEPQPIPVNHRKNMLKVAGKTIVAGTLIGGSVIAVNAAADAYDAFLDEKTKQNQEYIKNAQEGEIENGSITIEVPTPASPPTESENE